MTHVPERTSIKIWADKCLRNGFMAADKRGALRASYLLHQAAPEGHQLGDEVSIAGSSGGRCRPARYHQQTHEAQNHISESWTASQHGPNRRSIICIALSSDGCRAEQRAASGPDPHRTSPSNPTGGPVPAWLLQLDRGAEVSVRLRGRKTQQLLVEASQTVCMSCPQPELCCPLCGSLSAWGRDRKLCRNFHSRFMWSLFLFTLCRFYCLTPPTLPPPSPFIIFSNNFHRKLRQTIWAIVSQIQPPKIKNSEIKLTHFPEETNWSDPLMSKSSKMTSKNLCD